MEKAKQVIQLTIKGFLGKEVGRRSAGLTYYLVFAIFPFILSIIALLGALKLPMISLDEIRKEQKISPTENQSKVLEIARDRAKALLRKKQPFVWNATNVSPMVRGKQIQLFTQYHASSRIVYLETEWTEQLRRNSSRQDTVPEQAICHMMEELILPEEKEAHNVQWHCV